MIKLELPMGSGGRYKPGERVKRVTDEKYEELGTRRGRRVLLVKTVSSIKNHILIFCVHRASGINGPFATW